MNTEINPSSSKKAAPGETPAKASSTSPGGKEKTISPAERWLLIREKAYAHAQKRGFVGGNPIQEWLEAEQEVDAEHVTDYRRLFALTDTAEITEQVKAVLGGYGLGHLNVDALLDEHREGMERLAAFNRTMLDSTSELANRQTALFQDAVSEAVKTLESVAEGNVSTRGLTKQAELSTKAVEHAFSYIDRLMESMAGLSPVPRDKGDGSK